ncbi:unnamed protein product [Discula destructiva]
MAHIVRRLTIRLLLISVLLGSCAQALNTVWNVNVTEAEDELTTAVTHFENGTFQWHDLLDDDWVGFARDWSYYNYSSDEARARNSLVKYNQRLYDPLSFKGGYNDTYAMSFYLSTEVAVSAAQARNGSLIDVAAVKVSLEYKELMARIQLDLKGDRRVYYDLLEPNFMSNPGSFLQFLANTLGIYIHQTLDYFGVQNIKGSSSSPPSTYAVAIFKDVLISLKEATEQSLQIEMRPAESRFKQFKVGKVNIVVGAPWKFNSTLAQAISNATEELNIHMLGEWYDSQSKVITIPPPTHGDLLDHTNDEMEYGGEEGTRFAFQQARDLVEMEEFDATYGLRYGDMVCGTYLNELEGKIRAKESSRAQTNVNEPVEHPA